MLIIIFSLFLSRDVKQEREREREKEKKQVKEKSFLTFYSFLLPQIVPSNHVNC